MLLKTILKYYRIKVLTQKMSVGVWFSINASKITFTFY